MIHSHKTTVLFMMVLLFSAGLFFFRLGDRGFRNPDEGRYAEIAREMVATGNWIEPKIYGVDYLKKPPLFYWLTAASVKIFGPNEWAARSVPALFGIAGVLMTFWFTRKIFGDETAFFSSLILTANFWYLQVCRFLVIDAVFSFFVISGIYFFYTAIHAQQNDRRYYLLFYICMSLSFLAKGVLGIILPAISLGIYLLKHRKVLAVLKNMGLGWGILVFSVIALPWYIAISIKNTDFLRLFFIHENFSRFASKNFEHQQGWYFYIALLPAILMPWLLFVRPLKAAVSNFRKDADRQGHDFFLLATGLGFVLFFSLSKGKLLTYILPSVPFFLIVVGRSWHVWLEAQQSLKKHSHWAEGLPLFFLLFLGLTAVVVTPAVISCFSKDMPDGVGVYFQLMGAVILAGAIAGIRAWKRQNLRHLFYILILMTAVLSAPFSYVMEAFNADYTNKHFAKELKPRLSQGDKVFIYDHPGAFYDFGFYLAYPVTLVGLEGELELSRNNPENSKAVVTHDQFKGMLEHREKLFCLARKSDFSAIEPEIRKNLTVIKEDRRKVLFST